MTDFCISLKEDDPFPSFPSSVLRAFVRPWCSTGFRFNIRCCNSCFSASLPLKQCSQSGVMNLVGENAIDPASEEMTLIQYVFGALLQSQIDVDPFRFISLAVNSNMHYLNGSDYLFAPTVSRCLFFLIIPAAISSFLLGGSFKMMY
ncbi:uncharacterized protein [Euphorbia lathyris]|uniref:uncharacterized protein isoform X2 n=1 Tax=Euphorbia lathyris TaxID=212925 RepID=UPI0033143654